MNAMSKRTGNDRPVCFICGSGRQRNLLQILLKGWPVPARNSYLYCCLRCLLGGGHPPYPDQRRYKSGSQVAEVLRFKTINHIHQRYGVGSFDWLELDVSIFD